MIANAVLHLLSDPGQLELVRVDPRLVPAAIEESLRLEPAAALLDRYATRDCPAAPRGLIFRKPPALHLTWDPPSR